MENELILNEIFKAARAATLGIDNITPKTSHELMGLIEKQNKLYEEITSTSQKIARNNNYKLTDVSPFMKAGSYMQTQMDTMFDKSNSNIAELMFNGTNMGIVNMQRLLNENHNTANQEIIELIKTFKSYMEDFVNSIKQYL